MALPSAKELKKLALACRKAGIKTLKAEGIEFTLSDAQPLAFQRAPKASKALTNQDSPVQVEDSWDDLSEMDKIMWSAPSTGETA